MDDTKDYVTINIRLTKGNYNRMWEIKVTIQFRYYLPTFTSTDFQIVIQT